MNGNLEKNNDTRYREIFLSYRRADLYAVKLIEKYLVELDYPRPFFDMDVLHTGEEYEKIICEAIRNCTDFILIISPNTFATKKGVPADSFVIKEIKCALDNNVAVIPLLLDGAVFPEESQLPESIADLSRIHAAPLDFKLSLGEDYILSSLRKQFEKRLNTRPLSEAYTPLESVLRVNLELQEIQARNLEKFDVEQIGEICSLLAQKGKTEGITVLDVGCGDGSCGRARFRGPQFSKVIGIDMDSNKINEAEEKKKRFEKDANTEECDRNKYYYYTVDVDKRHCSELIETINKLMKEHDIEDGFDIIFVANVLHLLEYPGEVLKGMYEVLGDDGYIFTRCSDDRMKVADGDNGLLGKIIQDTQNMGIKADRKAGSKQYVWLENARFRDVRIKALFRSTDGLKRKQKEDLFRESFEWRKEIAEDIKKDDVSPLATRETCDRLISSIDTFSTMFTDRFIWYCEVDFAAIATK